MNRSPEPYRLRLSTPTKTIPDTNDNSFLLKFILLSEPLCLLVFEFIFFQPLYPIISILFYFIYYKSLFKHGFPNQDYDHNYKKIPMSQGKKAYWIYFLLIFFLVSWPFILLGASYLYLPNGIFVIFILISVTKYFNSLFKGNYVDWSFTKWLFGIK